MANINVVIDEVAKLNPDLARQIQKYVKTHSYLEFLHFHTQHPCLLILVINNFKKITKI